METKWKAYQIPVGSTAKIRFLPPCPEPPTAEHHIRFKSVSAYKRSPHHMIADMQATAQAQWIEEVEMRNGALVSVDAQEIQGRHNHERLDNQKVKGCLACLLEAREAEGNPPWLRIYVTVLRDKSPLNLVEAPVLPRQHKRRRWMSDRYHQRIQKKWNKRVAGLTCMRPEQETVILSMSKLAFVAVRKFYSKGDSND